MAANSVIGALRVVIGADSAALETGLKNAGKQLSGFANQAKISAAVIAGAFAGIAAGIGVSIKRTIDEADKLGKLAQSIGVPVDQLSRLKHAADLSGVGLEDLGKSLGKLSKNMVEAAGAASGPAARAFAALGISVKNADGTLKSSSEVMTELAGKFGAMEDGAGKTALAIALFGRAGAALIPLLNSGAAGLKEMMEEADQLGIVIDTKTAKAAEAFNDNLTRLGKVKDGIIQQVTARMLPAFLQLSQVLIDSAKNSELMQTAADGIVSAIRGAVTVALTAVVVFQRLAAEITAFWAVLQSSEWANTKKAWAEFLAAGEETKKAFEGLGNFVAKFYESAAATAEKAAATIGPKIAAPIIAGATAAKDALQRYLDTQAKKLAADQAEAQTIGLLVGARERLRVQLEAAAIGQANATINMDKYRAAIDLAAIAASNMALKIAGLKLTEELLLPWEEFNKKLDMNRQLFEAGAISVETYGRANRRVAEMVGATWDMAGASIAGSFATIAGSFGESNSAMATAAKAFGIAQAIISTYTGMAKALELPFPANIAAAVAVAAKGFAFVASIKSTAIPKFAHGADFVVGGAGGVDNNRMMMDLSRGERVRIDPPGTSAGGERVVHELRGIPPRGLITGEYLRELIGNINAAGRDGYRIEFAPA